MEKNIQKDIGELKNNFRRLLEELPTEELLSLYFDLVLQEKLLKELPKAEMEIERVLEKFWKESVVENVEVYNLGGMCYKEKVPAVRMGREELAEWKALFYAEPFPENLPEEKKATVKGIVFRLIEVNNAELEVFEKLKPKTPLEDMIFKLIGESLLQHSRLLKELLALL
ncbi:hypothetical protein ADU37_CDS19980 [Thermococcus sp. 2319x1]|uniref:hypothetical protein n=1 Tax=Thermococcus sp. 2319x1 TaxID=1674923 RepID=UPI00073ACCB8|nr:hypothetical protein [Thermococcus sp. 2319x1]ALV63697.1 hypothetical protein ADU37_CDS19980 [Thermococcus sp. 2319x1]